MVELVTCYTCEVGFLRERRINKTPGSRNGLLKSVNITEQSRIPPLRSKRKEKNQFWGEFKEDNWNPMDKFLAGMIFIGRRWSTSGSGRRE